MTHLLDAARFIEEESAFAVGAPEHGTAPAVVFDAAGKVFKPARGQPAVALTNVRLNVRRGEIFGIIGRSGAGKSTLLRLVNGLEKPSSGAVLVNGVSVGELGESGLVTLRRRIGMVFQHFNLLSAKTVYDNIALPLRIAGVSRAAIEEKVSALLDLVGLSAKRDAFPASLSGGQKQRVGIARALVHDPDILLCDEATSALDPETTQSILALLRDINRRLGLTIILITHEMGVIREACDTVAVIEQGAVVETGPVWRVFGEPQHDATRALLRTLVHALPDDLAARLKPASSPALPGEAADVLLDVRYTGASGNDPDLAALSSSLTVDGGAVRFVHGGIDRIQGHAQGRLVLAARLSAHERSEGAFASRIAVLVERARRHADHVEVLGYV